MNRLITAQIDVTKIDKSKLFKGKKGTYLDLTIWLNETPDKFGNDISIEQRTGKGDNKIFLGNGKFYVKDEKKEAQLAPITSAGYDDLPVGDDGEDSLPF